MKGYSQLFHLAKGLCKSGIAFVFCFCAQNLYGSFLTGKDCGEDVLKAYGTQVSSFCATITPANLAQCQAEQACYPQLKAAVQKCQSTVYNDFAALQAAQAGVANVQMGSFDSAIAASKASSTNTGASAVTNGVPGTGACAGNLGMAAQRQIDGKRNVAALGAAGSAANAAGAAKGMSPLTAGLVGAAVGAGIGYLMSDKGGSSSAPAESPPPVMPPPPPPPPPPTSSSSSSVSATRPAVIETPATVRIPSMVPGQEAGTGNSRIRVAQGDVIKPDSLGGSTAGTSSNGSTAGGSTAGGASAGGASAGGGSTGDPASGASTGASSSQSGVGDGPGGRGGSNSGVLGLAGSGFQFANESSSDGTGGIPGQMILGLPARSTKRALTNSTVLKSTKKLAPKATATTTRSLAKSGSTANPRTPAVVPQDRDQIKTELKKRGLIGQPITK